jgi:hypothetical protein
MSRSLLYAALGLILAACNLQQGPPTDAATAAPDQSTSSPAPLPTEADSLPPLQATPTQLPLLPIISATLPSAPTTSATLIPGTLPTLDAAQADERFELSIRAGDRIGVNFEVTISSGTVMMQMQGAEGVVWQKSFSASETGREEVTVTQGGTYELLVTRRNLEGSYAVSWD